LQALPHAANEAEAVRSWRTDNALAEKTPRNMVAKSIFCSMISPFYFFHFGRAGGGPSGWQTPVVPPPTPKKQPHGRLQMSPLVHGLPHATIA